MDEKAIRRALMTAKNLAIAVDPGFSRVRLPEPRLPAPLERASGGEVEPFHPIGSPEREENLSAFMEKAHPSMFDESGKPKVFYHGTAVTSIRSFKGGRGVAGHFGLSPRIANEWAKARHENEQETLARGEPDFGDAAVVYPVHISAKNPFDKRNPHHLKLVGLEPHEVREWEELEQNLPILKKHGFDSYWDWEDGNLEEPSGIAVFDSKNIKSASGNRGTFDYTNKDITKSSGGEVERLARATGGSTMDPGWAEETRRHLAKLRNVYSVAARAARNLKQKYGKPEQMIAAIRNAPGVKPEELKWSRVEQEFAGKDRVSRDDLAEHFERSIPPITGDQTNRHATHTLPGGENYRAYVLTLDPDIIDPEHPGYKGMREDPFVKESHYSNPNVVASYRVKDRFDETANRRADTAAYRKLPKETIPVQWGTGPESMERKEIRAAKIGPGLYVHRPIDGSSEDRKKAWVLTHGPTGLKLISDLKSMDHVKKAAEAVQSMWGGIENQSEAEAREFANSEQGKAIGKELLRIRQEPLRKDTALHIDELQSDWGQEVREAGGMRDTAKETPKEVVDEFYNKLYANAKSIISGYQKHIEEAAKRVYPDNQEAQDASVQYMTHRPLDGQTAHTFDAYWKYIRDLREHRARSYSTLPPPDSVMRYIASLGALVLDSTPYPDSHPFAGEKRSYRKVGTEMMFGGIESTDPFVREGERTRHGDYGSAPNDFLAHADALMDHYQRIDPEHLHPGVFRTVAHQLRRGAEEQRSLPPAAPHVGTTQGWTDIALKHAINHAVKNGYSSIILSPGEVHAQRWNKLDRAGTIGLSKPSEIGTYTVAAHWNPMGDPDFNINEPNDAKVLKNRKEVERYLGRDTAAKLFGDAPLEQHEERTEDSGVTYLTSKERSTKYGYGGEGYREFYDEVVPRRLLALARMHDPNVQLEPISGYTNELKGSLSALPGIRITPEMAESVKKEGFPAYASGGSVPDPEQPRKLDYQGLYSHAAESAEQMKQAEGPRDQMISTLKNIPGVKDEELRWARLDELPERVTRQDLADRLREYMPQIDVDNLLETRDDEDDEEYEPGSGYTHYGQYAYPGGSRYREKLLTFNTPGQDIKYGLMEPYEPPHFRGEHNLLAHVLMTDRLGKAGRYLHIDELQSDWAQEGRKKGFADNRPFAAKRARIEEQLKKDMEGKYREAYKNYLSGVTEGDNMSLKNRGAHAGGQWEPSGPLARNPIADLSYILESHPNAYANEEIRKAPEFAEAINMYHRVKSPVISSSIRGFSKPPLALFEESDFDALRDHFRNNPQLADKLADIVVNKYQAIGNLRETNPDQSFNRLLQEVRDESDRASRGKNPAVPYVENTQSWVDRGLKSVFQDAAKNRYDYVTWSPGRVVADKYNLADKISHLDFSHNPHAQQWSLSGYKVPDFDEMEADEMSDEEFIRASEEAGQKFSHNAVPDDKLEQYVGGEVARRMRQEVADNPGKQQHRLTRGGLEVPHKGMHDFYDKILPKRALALAREHDPDAKIEIVPATPDHPESIHGFMSIRITPKMRESMMKKGFKAYRRGGTVEAVDAPIPVLDRDKAIRRAMMIAKAEGGPVAGGLSFPAEEAAFRLRTKLNREAAVAAGKKADPGLPSNERTIIRAPRAKKGEKQLPNFVTGNLTYRDWIDRHSRLMTPEEAHAFSKWYKEIHGEFMKYTNNNAHDASVLMRAWLVAQQNIAPAPAMSNVLLQREQILRGVPEGEMVAGGMPNPTQAARSVLRGEPIKAGVGRKIADFVDSAEGRNLRAYLGNDPQGGEPFVVDVHTARDAGLVDPALINHLRGLGYNEEDLAKVQHDFDASPSDAQYENRAEWGRNLTKHLNKIGWLGKKDWRPEEVQAVGWMGMTRLTRDAAETSVTGLAKNLRRVSFELSPGEGSPWADKYGEAFNGLPDQDKYAITDHMTKRAFELGNSIAQTYPVGLVQGTGAWEKYQNPSTVAQVLASAHGSETLANIIGHLLHQTEVWSNNVKPVTAGPKGFAIDFMENGSRNLADRNELQNFWQRVMDADDTHPNPDKKLIKGYQPITSPDGRVGVRVLIDKGGAATGQKLDQTLSPGGSIDTMLKGLPYDITSHLAEAEITKARNDWRTDKDGQAYLQRLRALTGRDLEPQLRHHGASLAQELERHLDQAYQGQGRSWRTAPQGQAQGPVTPPAFASGGSVDRALQIVMRARQGVRR